MKNYINTKVDWAKSQSSITKLLNSKGIYETRFTNLEDRFALEFRFVENGISKPLTVRIVVPLEKIDNEEKHKKYINQLYRVLFYHLKAKFIAIESGLTEFIQEFMPHLVIMDKLGNSTTMSQALLPQYKKNLETGEQGEFKLLN